MEGDVWTATGTRRVRTPIGYAMRNATTISVTLSVSWAAQLQKNI
jgi:hypothetical protein